MPPADQHAGRTPTPHAGERRSKTTSITAHAPVLDILVEQVAALTARVAQLERERGGRAATAGGGAAVARPRDTDEESWIATESEAE